MNFAQIINSLIWKNKTYVEFKALVEVVLELGFEATEVRVHLSVEHDPYDAPFFGVLVSALDVVIELFADSFHQLVQVDRGSQVRYLQLDKEKLIFKQQAFFSFSLQRENYSDYM